jgi:hypothetical protein
MSLNKTAAGLLRQPFESSFMFFIASVQNQICLFPGERRTQPDRQKALNILQRRNRV